MNTSVSSAAEEYFSNINPIAARIYADFQDTKNAYDCIWDTLSHEEQTEVLNESIIKPEVTLKYNLKTIGKKERTNDGSMFGQKRVVDENVSYRDEHSAPFSFKTTSQIDLRLFESNVPRKVVKVPKVEVPVLKVCSVYVWVMVGS